MPRISGQPFSFSILGDPGAVSQGTAISSGESLLVDVNFRSKMLHRLASWCPRTFKLQVPSMIPSVVPSSGIKPLESTGREDDQRFPSKIQDGGWW